MDFSSALKLVKKKEADTPAQASQASHKRTLVLAFLLLILVGAYAYTHYKKNHPPVSSSKNQVQANINDVKEVITQAHLLLLTKKTHEAIGLLEAAVLEHPEEEDLLLEMGIAYRKAKRHDDAENIYQKALQNNPNCFECWNNRALNQIQAGNSIMAQAWLQEVLRKKPAYTDAYLNLGLAYEKAGQAQEAIDTYQEYLKAIPNNDSHAGPAMVRERIRRLQEEI